MAQKHINPIQSREQVIKASESNFTELYNMASQGEPNVIEEVQVNGTALPVDSNKAVNVIVPTALSQLSNDSGFITSADIPPQEMYWCTYGTTTYAEITQAVADGKVPMIKYNGITYMYSKDWGSSLGHLFGTMDANFDRWVYCKQTNVWGTGYMEVENAVNKKTSISSTSTNVQYPSAKAVWDALPKKTSDLTNDSGFITSGDLPTVNNATLTIQKNGTNVATFDANASSNVTANITVPTNVSELANDSNFVSTSDIDQIYDGTSSNAQSGVAIDGALQPIIAVAQGKTKSYVIQGQSDITGTKDANEEYTNVTAITGITLSDLQVGDIINLKDLNVPDYWVSQVSPSVSLNKMETTKVDLSDYVDKSNPQTITGIKTFYESDGSATSSSKIILKGEHLNKTTNPSSNRFLSIDFRDKNGTTLTKFSTIQTSDGYSGFIAGAGTDPTSPSNNLLMLVNNSNNSKLLLIPATASHSYSAVRRDFYNNNTVTLSGNQTIGGTKTFSATPVFSSGEIGDSTHTFTLPSTNGQLALVTDISYPVTSVNGQTGAVSLSIPTALSELTNDTNFATTNDLANYLPLIGGTMTGAITTIENQAGIILRGHASYLAGISYRTNGDEAMCFENKYAPASWIFRNKSPTSYSTSWTDVTPSMQIKNQCVAINKLIPSGSNGSYNLDVSGTANATTIYENGTALSNKYMDINTSIPTKTSDLTNDSGFITSSAIPTNISAFTNDSGYLTSAVTSLGGKSGALTLGSGLSITASGEVYATGTGAKIVDLGTITLPYTLSDAQYNEVLNNDNVILKYTTSNSTQYVKKLMSFGDYIYFDKTYKDYDSNDGGLGYIMPTIKKSTKKLTHEVQSIFFVGNGLTYDTSTESLAVDTTTIALKSDIPTESTVSGWGFTKNTGTITGVQLNGSSIATSGVANVKALPNFNLNISHQTAGNPRPVKFLTVNYNTKATYFKMSATSCHDNGTSYQFLEDIIIGCTTGGSVVCNVYKYCQQTVTYDSATRNYGDVFYVIDTTNKIVDFYILCGQYASSQFTPATKIGNTTIAYITQYTGTATYYSSGTKVWANGNSTTYAKLSDVPSTSNFVDLTSAQSISGVKTFTNGISVSGRSAGGGDDEGIVVGRAANNYAGVCLGSPSGMRSVFYLTAANQPVWRWNNGSASYDIVHPAKAGTIALTSDLAGMSLKFIGKYDSKTSVSDIGLDTSKHYLIMMSNSNNAPTFYNSSDATQYTNSPVVIRPFSGWFSAYIGNKIHSVYSVNNVKIFEIENYLTLV